MAQSKIRTIQFEDVPTGLSPDGSRFLILSHFTGETDHKGEPMNDGEFGIQGISALVSGDPSNGITVGSDGGLFVNVGGASDGNGIFDPNNNNATVVVTNSVLTNDWRLTRGANYVEFTANPTDMLVLWADTESSAIHYHANGFDWYTGASSASNAFIIERAGGIVPFGINAAPDGAMVINTDGSITFGQYGIGTFLDATPQYLFGVNISGDLVEFDASGLGANGVYTSSNEGQNWAVSTNKLLNTTRFEPQNAASNLSVFIGDDSGTGSTILYLATGVNSQIRFHSLGAMVQRLYTSGDNFFLDMEGADTATRYFGIRSVDNTVAFRINNNKDVYFYGYPNTRDDGTPVNVLGTSAGGLLQSYPVASLPGGDGNGMFDANNQSGIWAVDVFGILGGTVGFLPGSSSATRFDIASDWNGGNPIFSVRANGTVSVNTISINNNLIDSNGTSGLPGQILSQDAGGVTWIDGGGGDGIYGGSGFIPVSNTVVDMDTATSGSLFFSSDTDAFINISTEATNGSDVGIKAFSADGTVEGGYLTFTRPFLQTIGTDFAVFLNDGTSVQRMFIAEGETRRFLMDVTWAQKWENNTVGVNQTYNWGWGSPNLVSFAPTSGNTVTFELPDVTIFNNLDSGAVIMVINRGNGSVTLTVDSGDVLNGVTAGTQTLTANQRAICMPTSFGWYTIVQ